MAIRWQTQFNIIKITTVTKRKHFILVNSASISYQIVNVWKNQVLLKKIADYIYSGILHVKMNFIIYDIG